MTQIEISIAREKLTEGPDYETATFGLLEIKGNGKSLMLQSLEADIRQALTDLKLDEQVRIE
jgi:hypothetical protein